MSQDVVDWLRHWLPNHLTTSGHYFSITVISLQQDNEVQLIEYKRFGVYIHQLIAAQSSIVSNSDRPWNYSENIKNVLKLVSYSNIILIPQLCQKL